MYVRNYENWVFAQPAKDWCVSSYKTVFDALQGLGNESSNGRKWGLTDARGRLLLVFLDIKTSERNRLEFANLTQGEMSPVSSGD